MQTVKSYAQQALISTRTVQRQIDKFNELNQTNHQTGVNSELPEEVLQYLSEKYETASPDAVSITDTNDHSDQRTFEPVQKKSRSQAKKTDRFGSVSVGRILQIIALLSLGLVASYGVYEFSTHFVRYKVFAFAEAIAFELTYVGLAFCQDLSVKAKKKAEAVSFVAMIISAFFNTCSNAMNMDPELSAKLSPFVFWLVSAVRGIPVPVLAYFMADLIIHQKK